MCATRQSFAKMEQLIVIAVTLCVLLACFNTIALPNKVLILNF
jgi:hypothetical protein